MLFRDGCGHTLHRARQRIVVRIQIVQRGDMTARNDQDVQGRLRVDIPDRNDLVILMDEASRDLSCDDLAEEAIVHDRWMTAVRGMPCRSARTRSTRNAGRAATRCLTSSS